MDFKSSTWKVSFINVQSVCSKSMNSSELNYSTKKPSAFLTEKKTMSSQQVEDDSLNRPYILNKKDDKGGG